MGGVLILFVEDAIANMMASFRDLRTQQILVIICTLAVFIYLFLPSEPIYSSEHKDQNDVNKSLNVK